MSDQKLNSAVLPHLNSIIVALRSAVVADEQLTGTAMRTRMVNACYDLPQLAADYGYGEIANGIIEVLNELDECELTELDWQGLWPVGEAGNITDITDCERRYTPCPDCGMWAGKPGDKCSSCEAEFLQAD